MDFIKQYKGLPTQIYYLSATRIIIEMGMMFVFPFMSLLLTTRLGFSTVQAGYVMVLTSFGNMAGSLLGGKLADEFGRKRVYSILTVVITIAMTLAGFLCTKPIIILFVFISYACISAIMPAISAMIVDMSDDSNRSECFSLMYVMGNIGCATGPIIAGLLFYRHMPWIFFSMAIMYAICFVIIGLKIDDKYVPHRTRVALGTAQKKEESLFHIVFSKTILLVFVICLVLLTICYIELDFVLPLQLNDIFGLDKGSKMESLAWTINGACCVVLSPFIISFTKKNSSLFNIACGCILYAVGFGMYGLHLNMGIFILASMIWTSGEILIITDSGVFLAEHSPETHNGRLTSLYEFSRGIGKCLGPLMFGYLISDISFEMIWLMIAGICLLVSLVIAILHKHE